MISLLSSIALCFSAFSFAWINWNVDLNSNSLVFTSGESVLYVDYYGYKKQKSSFISEEGTTSEKPTPFATYITSTGEKIGESSGAYNVETNFKFDESVSLLDFYVGEHTFNYDLLPKVYLEFQYLKDVFDGYITASINVTEDKSSGILEFYYVTEPNEKSVTESGEKYYEHILCEGRTEESYDFTKADSLSSIQLFTTNGNDIPDKDGYTKDAQLKVPEFNNHNSDGKLLYSKATLIMIKFNSAKFINYITENNKNKKDINNVELSLSFKITFDYSNDPYYTLKPNNTQTSGNTSAWKRKV